MSHSLVSRHYEILESRRLLSGGLPAPVIPADSDRIAFLDFDQNGFADLIGAAPLTASTSQFFMQLGTGNSGFDPAIINNEAPVVVTDVVSGDMNEDGGDDNLLIGPTPNGTGAQVTLAFEGQGVRVFATEQLQGSAPLLSSDKWLTGKFLGGGTGDLARVSADGQVEIFLSMNSSLFQPNYMMLRPQSALFTPGVTSAAGGDFNQDGWVDLLATTNGRLELSWATGCGTYAPPITIGGFTDAKLVTAGDVDGDQDDDIVVGLATDAAATLLNAGNGAFGSPIFSKLALRAGTTKLDIGRFNNDANVDLLMHFTNNGNGAITASRGLGGGSFDSQPRVASPTPSTPLADRERKSLADELID